MAQPQHQMPPRPFSPAQQSPSPSPSAPNYQMHGPPANKRPRLSPGSQSQPASPYPSYTASPGVTTPSSIASPTHQPLPIPPPNPQANYGSPYPNGTAAVAPTLHLPTPQPNAAPPMQTPPIHTPQTPSSPYGLPSYSQATLAPMPAQVTPGVMGPPSKPPEKQTKEYQYEFDDSLAGTGIDLRQEEQLQQDYFAGTYRSEAKTGFPANPPGNRASFYGAGLANQPAQPAEAEQQDSMHLQAAKRAWNDSAKALAVARSQEVRNPFLTIPILHARANKIANDYGIGLNLDPKTGGPGKLRADADFPKPQVTVKTKIGPDGALVSTSSSFIPEDSFLVDQIALLSISTKHRLRELLGEANRLAVTRQHTSHGEVPPEWADAAAPLATPGQTIPRKRSFDAHASDAVETGRISKANHITQSLRDISRAERELEEQRLLRRQQREAKKADPSASSPASAAPGTPGSTAGAPGEKAPTKKELKNKTAAAKAAEASNTASANQTSTLFLGGGRKKKTYSWMNPGSGASTPTRPGAASQGLPGTPGAARGAPGSANASLTSEGRTKLGVWREDGDKGKNIHLRDWVFTLEADGKCEKTLQQAYDRLDTSQPK